MSIYTKIKEDHDEMRDLLQRIEALGPHENDARDNLFNMLKEKVIVHSVAEEKAFYNPLKRFKDMKEEIEHGKEEHEEAEELLEELTDTSLGGTAWMQKFRSLKDSLEHHMREEEREIFPDAKEVLTQDRAETMEQEMIERADKEKYDSDIDHRRHDHIWDGKL
ncbi:hemerythrin domain-containing protein [Kordiimonas gwangyangensis]|uniref:hemerythrin domain-containing protein n=1 Tax=Kordiimonas gwangyangensis TaxID=288022 RepID=UPI00036E4D98|nr:hemerythrin domain-containing protein [Kordiimonas gwangyangensis]